MRILVLSDLYPPVGFGGYELETALLVERLRERHDVLVLTTDLRRDETGPAPGVQRELAFTPRGRVRAVLHAPGAAVRAARLTRGTLARFAPDLVYVANGAAMPQAATVVACTAGAPVVCRFSELWLASNFLTGDLFLRHLEPGETGLRGLWACGIRAGNRAHPALHLPARPQIEATLSWASAALRDLATVPGGVIPLAERVIYPAPPEAARFAALERRPPDRPTVLYLGRVTVAKGAEVACRALLLLRERHGLDARLRMAGAVTADMRARVERLAADLGIGPHVELTGHLDADRAGREVASCSVVLVPSVEPEALGLVAVEAALARTPVVASRAGGLTEALLERRHALFFTPGDAEEAAARLAETLRNGEETQARTAAAHRHAQRFSAAAYLDACEELIGLAAEAAHG